MARKEVQREFPHVRLTEVDFRYKEAPKSGGFIIMVKYHTSDKEYPLYTQSRGDAEKTLNKKLPKRIKDALGKSVTEELNETNAQLQELQNQEAAQQKAFQQAETRAAEAQHLRREMDAIRARNADISAQIQQLKDTHGKLDKEAIQKLKDEKRSLEADHQELQKQLDAAAKGAKEAQERQQDINKTRLRKGETERRLAELKAQKDAIQPIDELKQKAAELNEHITEDMRIIEDENTSPSERTAARERLAVRNEELELLNEEIEARERQRPLLERVKDIFKKYGWTLQAVVLAVGIVLSALSLAGLNGLKAGTKAVGQGLQAIGKKLGSLLPGLIGSIVSFIFKACSWRSTPGCSSLPWWPSLWKGCLRRGVDNQPYHSKSTNCYKGFVYVMRVNGLRCDLWLRWWLCWCCWLRWCGCGWLRCRLFWGNSLGFGCLFEDWVGGVTFWGVHLAWAARH